MLTFPDKCSQFYNRRNSQPKLVVSRPGIFGQQYENALKGQIIELSWTHHQVNLKKGRFEVFMKFGLPKYMIWAVLGEAYDRAKGDGEKSTVAFQEALKIEPRDLWLQRVVGEEALKSSTSGEVLIGREAGERETNRDG